MDYTYFPKLSEEQNLSWKQQIQASLTDPRPSLSLDEVEQRVQKFHQKALQSLDKEQVNVAQDYKIS